MKPQLTYASIVMFLILVLCISSVSAATLYITNVTGVGLNHNETVGIYLNNSFDPNAASITYAVYYDETIIQANSIKVASGGVVPKNMSSPITIAYASASGYPIGNTWLANITFMAKMSGSVSKLGITLDVLDDLALPPKNLIPDTSIQNGTFTTASAAPVASFTGTPASGKVPLTVAFTDSSTNTPTSWSWSFGDGVASIAQDPTHIYSVNGSYTVTLTATNSAGSNTFTRAKYITVTSVAPLAAFTGSPTSGTAPLVVQFTDISTHSPTGWIWNATNVAGNNTPFTFSTSQSPLSIFGAGNFSIKLNATSSNGFNVSSQVTFINVSAPAPGPVASFTGTPTSGTAPLTVTFTDTSTNTPTFWNWNFGDGSTNTTKNPVHTYTSTGSYTVALNATNSLGSNLFTRTNYVTVTSPTTISTIGVFRNGVYYLRNTNTAGNADLVFMYGTTGDIPVTGDWTGQGKDTVGIFRQGMFYLRNSNSPGNADNSFAYGATTDKPLVGHWTGQGKDTVGVFRQGQFYLASSNSNGGGEVNAFSYGAATDFPLVGDWTGKGYDTIGVYRQGVFYLRDSNSAGNADNVFTYGAASGDIPVVWHHDGKDTVGIFRSGTFYLKNTNSAGNADNVFTYGAASDFPVTGMWT